MRILFVTNNYTPYSGGVVSSIRSSVAALRAAGHTVHIITLDFLGTQHKDPTYVLRVQCPIKFTYKTNPMALPWRPYAQILRVIKTLKPDVIHSHHPFLLGRDALKVARALGIPILFTYHTMYEQYLHYVPLPQPVTKPVVNKLVLDYCRAVDGIIAPSSAIEKYLHNQQIQTPIVVIPSGLQAMFVKELKQAKQVCAQNLAEQSVHASAQSNGYDWADRHYCADNSGADNYRVSCCSAKSAYFPFNLLVVSRFTKEKNIPFILDTFAQLPEQQKYRLTLVGYGADAEQLRQHAYDTLQLPPERVVFVHKPPKQQLLQQYRDADLFLFSSTTDTQGLVLAEAMACGTPVVAVDGPGQRDIIKQGQNGFLVSSTKQMGTTIAKITDNKVLHKTLSDGALKTAHAYDPVRTTEKLVEFYQVGIKRFR